MQLGRKELLTAVDCIRIGMDGMREKAILSVYVPGDRISVRRFDERQEVTLKDAGDKEGGRIFRKVLATFSSDRIIFRSSLKMSGIVTACDNLIDWVCFGTGKGK